MILNRFLLKIFKVSKPHLACYIRELKLKVYLEQISKCLNRKQFYIFVVDLKYGDGWKWNDQLYRTIER